MNLRLFLEIVFSFLVGVFVCDILLRGLIGSPNKVLAMIAGLIAIAYTIYSRPENEKKYERAQKENKKIQMLTFKPPVWLSSLFILLFLFDLRDFFGF